MTNSLVGSESTLKRVGILILQNLQTLTKALSEAKVYQICG
ncbi:MULTISPECIES: hypothetical protein [unclassified Microcoleus]|nr:MULTISPECIES: hypothetical protein [unclassified Microcoleus]